MLSFFLWFLDFYSCKNSQMRNFMKVKVYFSGLAKSKGKKFNAHILFYLNL